MRPVGDGGCVAGRLDACDVSLDTVHVDHGAGRAVFAGDLGGEGRCHALLSVRNRMNRRMGRAQRNPPISSIASRWVSLRSTHPTLKPALSLHAKLPAPATGLRRPRVLLAP